MASILVVEDELSLHKRIARALSAHQVQAVDSGAEALRHLDDAHPDLVLLDLRLPDASGLDLLAQIRAIDAELPVILMTAYSSVDDAVEAMRRGASDYLAKPLDFEKLRLLVDGLLARRKRERELYHLRRRELGLPAGVVGHDETVRGIFEDIERLADAGLAPGKRPAILLLGETGTGKGMTARAIHERLGGGPFLEVNCTAMPGNLIEAELFGHERGSFTDAKSSRTGLIEAADGGTLFLDEIGHLNVELQAKFLAVLETKRVRRIGSTRDREVDVQVIAATNRELDAAVASGEFRLDLLHRLQVLQFRLPPLRERRADIELIARHFCEEFGVQYRGEAVAPSPAALDILSAYAWPGNVRELRNVIERAVLLGRGPRVEPEDLHHLSAESPSSTGALGYELPPEGVSLERVEAELLRQALERAEGNQSRAAALLGMTRHAFRYRLEKHGLH